MIVYLKEKNLPGLLLNIDFEKAFDCIETFYTNIKSTLIVNGETSIFFFYMQGL